MFNREYYFSLLKDSDIGKELYNFDEIGSTNDYLKENADSLNHGAAAVAEIQTAGRGRRGSVWQTKPGDSLAISILLKPSETSGISLLCAVAAVRAVNELCGADAYIKWPNDIVWQGKKLCGILCEAKTYGNSISVICGFGLNLLQDGESFRRAGLPYAASLLTATGKSISLEASAAALCTAVGSVYKKYESGGIASILGEYREKSATLGREIRFTKDGTEFNGTASGILSDGSLEVLCPDGKMVLNAGEVSVRGIYGYV